MNTGEKISSRQDNYLKKVEKYEKLVDELMKTRPDESQVKSMMESLGLEYKAEPIERLNTVLRALHQ